MADDSSQADSDEEAPPPNQLSGLAAIPGHNDNRRVWRDSVQPAIRHDLGCSVKPWESLEVNSMAYLQRHYENNYDTGHVVEVGGPFHKNVSSFDLHIPLLLTSSTVTPILLPMEEQHWEHCN